MKYIYIFIPFLTVFLSQIIKLFVEGITNKKINFYRLIDGSGGMPSSHSAIVTSLTTIVGLLNGFDSLYFAICLIFSSVVLYDAMGVRYETGKQAEIINLLIKSNKSFKEKTIILKEKVGHKPIEVLCGCLLGIIVSLTTYYFI